MTAQPNTGTYYNTTHLNGEELKQAGEKAGRIDALVLSFFVTNHTEAFTPWDIWRALGHQYLICSIRRSINTLTKENHIYKTMGKKKEAYGAVNYMWKAIKPKE